MDTLSRYEQLREENILRNARYLSTLGLSNKKIKENATFQAIKRKIEHDNRNLESDGPPRRSARILNTIQTRFQVRFDGTVLELILTTSILR